MRPTNLKTDEANAIAKDIDAFLASGGKIKKLPSYGANPTEVKYTPETQYKIRTEFNGRKQGNDKSLPEDVYRRIDLMIAEGLPLIVIARKVGCSARTVRRRKDKLGLS